MATLNPTDNPKQTRRPRYGRGKTSLPLDILLAKPNTLPVLASLDRHELLTNGMLQDLLFRDHRSGNPSLKNEEAAMKRQADRLIRRLIDAGLVERGMVWYLSDNGFPYPSPYNQLTAKGADVLSSLVDTPLRYKSHRKDKGQDAARHALEINRFYVALQRACWQADIEVTFWVDDRQLAAMETSHTLLEHIPDAFFILQRGNDFFTHFLEADRGTETLVSDKGRKTDLLTKYTRYGDHLKHRFHLAPYFADLPLPVVLSVTTGGKDRRDNMLETATKAGGQGAYWFTTNAELYADKRAERFWGHHWHVSSEVSCRSLLTRLGASPILS